PFDGDLPRAGGERTNRRDAHPHPPVCARGVARRVPRLWRAGQVGGGEGAVRLPGVAGPPAWRGAAAATSAGPRAAAARREPQGPPTAARRAPFAGIRSPCDALRTMADWRALATGIVRRLREAGHEAYFAGGCVRDQLLGPAPPASPPASPSRSSPRRAPRSRPRPRPSPISRPSASATRWFAS